MAPPEIPELPLDKPSNSGPSLATPRTRTLSFAASPDDAAISPRSRRVSNSIPTVSTPSRRMSTGLPGEPGMALVASLSGHRLSIAPPPDTGLLSTFQVPTGPRMSITPSDGSSKEPTAYRKRSTRMSFIFPSAKLIPVPGVYNKLWGLRFDDPFLHLFLEKNSDGTKKFRFKGNELYQRFGDRLLPADMVYVCKLLKKHAEINELDVSYNGIEDEGLEILCQTTLLYVNSLEHINLSHCDITASGMKTLYLATKKVTFVKLKTLRLMGNKLGPTGGHFVALLIPCIPSLEYLDVGDTDQTVESLEFIILEVYLSNIKVLNISRALPASMLQIVNDTFLAGTLSELLRINETLVELHVQKCDLDAHDVEIIILGLKQNRSLRFLDLGYNNVCCVGLEFLSKWLKTRPELLGLCVAGNKIKNHGAVALSFGMPFSKLRYLDISYNNIGNEGIIAILHTAKKTYMLRVFLLWGNLFSHPALKILNRMMKSKVFEEKFIDVKIYCVDEVLYAARYPVDKYKDRYYNVTDYGCAVDLKIKKNRLEQPDDRPRSLFNFEHIDRHPPICCPAKPKCSNE